MATICDHTSVGMLVWHNNKLLLIERKKFPFGFAPPAGHIDGDASYEVSAERELKEEVGLDTEHLELLWEGRKENQCRREDGSWHYWKIYKTEAKGIPQRNEEETKGMSWYGPDELAALCERTQLYLDNLISEEEWEQSPGIEVVWYQFFTELGLA